MWLAEAASFLADQKSSAESADVKALQERQKKLKVKISLTKFLFYKCYILSLSSPNLAFYLTVLQQI